jgi:hypothetical protein
MSAWLNCIQLLIKNDLVDELWLKIYPLTLGKRKKLFDGSTIPAAFTLIESLVTPSGVMAGHYERECEVKNDDTMLNSPSEGEIARRERMKREG